MPPSSSQYITITATGIGSVRGLMQEAAPKLTDGDPNWEVVQRPRRPSLTLWRGRSPYGLTIPLLFDDPTGVEDSLTALDRMKHSPKTGVEPPPVSVNGAVPRRDIKNWVLTGIEYGDNVMMVMYRGVPIRIRQDVTVTLMERIQEARVAHAVIRAKHSFHIVKKGETLAKISQAEYGDVKHVAAIRKANNIADSRSPKVGQRLRMP